VTGIGKLWRALLGLIVVIGLIVVLNSWWGEYRRATESQKSSAPAAVVATATPAPANQKTVIVLTAGLNLRDKPDATGKTLRGLKRGEQFILVGTSGTWLQLRDTKGVLGWVTNNPAYIKVQK